jgi:hypothetical protein
VLRHDVQISLQTYKAMLARYNLGAPHLTLVGGEQWLPPEERVRLEAVTTDELAEAGLLRGGRLDEEFLDTLQLIQSPPVEYYTYAGIDGQQVTLRAVRNRGEAVIVAAHSGMIYLLPTRPDTLTLDLAAQLPDTPPAAGVHSMSCSQRDYDAIEKGKSLPTSPSVADAKRMLSLMRLPRRNAGQLYAAIRDGRGRRVRTQAPPMWIDTDTGRFLAISDTNGWFSLSAASIHDIAALWTRLENQLHTR